MKINTHTTKQKNMFSFLSKNSQLPRPVYSILKLYNKACSLNNKPPGASLMVMFFNDAGTRVSLSTGVSVWNDCVAEVLCILFAIGPW